MNVRPELARHLRHRLQAFGEGFRQNLALVGPPGSGKTFQLEQLLAEHPATALLIYCPVYREPCRSFLHRLLCAVLHAGCRAEGATAEAGAELETLLRCAEPRLPRTAAAIRQIEGSVTKGPSGEAFNRALDIIPILREEQRRPVVLMLDEFLFLEELGLAHAFHELGKRVMTWSSVLFILSSSAPYRARAILRERLQLLFGQFELLTLDVLDRETAVAWMRQELKALEGCAEMSAFLTRWLGLSPWYLSVVLKRLRELAVLRRRPELTESLLLQAVWDLVGSPEGVLHQWCRSRVEGLGQGRAGTRALDVLMHIADGAHTTTAIGARVGRAGLSGSLQMLLEHDLAQRNGTCWVVVDPILCCWLSTVLSAQRAEARCDEAGLGRRLERFLQSLWSAWSHAQQLSFSDQLVELFAKFNDETISLDSKTGRLPKFETITTQRPAPSVVEAYLVAEGQGRRWCAAVQEGSVDEQAVARFDAFCRAQEPRPSRKVMVTKTALDQNVRLLAKAASMWVWEPSDVNTLMRLYGVI